MIIQSILDSDAYKLSMQQAVIQKFPKAWAQYGFINRGGTKFPRGFAELLREEVHSMGELRLTPIENAWLGKILHLTHPYLDFLNGFRLNPDAVEISQHDGDMRISIWGPWYQTILWEVPLMAIISELYFRESRALGNLIEAEKAAAGKAMRMAKEGVKFADFGTRRRYSRMHHDSIVEELTTYGRDCFVGTSNLKLAMDYNLTPIGTQAHEWFMFHGATYGYRIANRVALENWVDVYQGDLGIALTDTYTTKSFLDDFDLKHAKLFDGVRQDSGDPKDCADRILYNYEGLGIDPKSKTIVFSDSLNVDKAIELNNTYSSHTNCRFGIGTHLTNDIEGVKPLNMVIKMIGCSLDGEKLQSTVKLSDSPGKETGNPSEIRLCKQTLGI